jgi:hypothetical protein
MLNKMFPPKKFKKNQLQVGINCPPKQVKGTREGRASEGTRRPKR